MRVLGEAVTRAPLDGESWAKSMPSTLLLWLHGGLRSTLVIPLPTNVLVISTSRVRWPWARWSLARQLPVITAAIVVLVMTLSLTLTYKALVQARADALHSRIQGLLGVLIQAGEASAKARVAALHQLARDSALVGAVAMPRASGWSAKDDSAVATALNKVSVPADSGLPVELWTTDGRRVAHVGVDVRDDSIAALAPELRSRRGTKVSEVPAPWVVKPRHEVSAFGIRKCSSSGQQQQ